MRLSIAQSYQTRFGGCEADATVEMGKARFEVDVKPLRTAVARQDLRPFDQAGCDALSSKDWIHAGIENESVNAAIPGDVDETDECRSGKCADMGEASR